MELDKLSVLSRHFELLGSVSQCYFLSQSSTVSSIFTSAHISSFQIFRQQFWSLILEALCEMEPCYGACNSFNLQQEGHFFLRRTRA